MKELSVFVDESGDFGEYSAHSPYYIISMVFHDQESNIEATVEMLDRELQMLGYTNHCVHTGPIIRQESDYINLGISERRRILNKMMAFFKQADIKVKSFYIEKRQVEDRLDAVGKLAKQMAGFIKDNYEFFLSYDKVKVYYDNGQVDVTSILSSVFNSFLNDVEFRKVYPSEYKLFQVADLICTMKLLKLKMDSIGLSKGELKFFGSPRELKKQYLKHIEKKVLQ